MTDLCFTCQQNTLKLVWAANLPEEEKSQCVQAWQPHLNSVQTERELYRQVCEKAKCSFEELEDQIDLEESHDSCSFITIKVLFNSLFSWTHHTFLDFISSTTRYIIRGLNEAEAVFLSACLLQIVNLKFIFLLKSIFKRNYNLPLRIDFIKSPFCCVQCLTRIFVNILSRSIFIFEWGCGSAAHVCLLKRDWGNSTNKFKTVNKVMLIVANVLIKKLTSICW